jgi:hypothetical protein
VLTRRAVTLFVGIALSLFTLPAIGGTMPDDIALDDSIARLADELVAKHGEQSRARAMRGMQQVASLWRAGDGDAAAFEAFVRTHFAATDVDRKELLDRFDYLSEQLNGSMLQIVRAFRRQADLDIGPILPVDRIVSGYNPAAHVLDDFFGNKVAFVVLLNFPLTTLDEKIANGDAWSNRDWAEARLAERFGKRVPAEVSQRISAAVAAADDYIANYNVWMHHLLDDEGNRLFKPGLRLITHWNLRDELKAQYAEKDGLARQRMIQQVMERIVTQTIPRVVVDNPHVDWKPYANTVTRAAAKDSDSTPPPDMKVTADREPDTRYETVVNIFRAVRAADPYSPAAPTLIARRFDENRELPEERVEAMLRDVLSSPLRPRVAKLIETRLGRKLEPFDIWYDGFKARGAYTDADLSAITKKKYPTPEAFAADIPNILVKLGFTEERAQWLADRIEVDPSRGAGHAFGAAKRGDKAHLRARVGRDGMDYKGYNIAVHELGHNVEQTFSLYEVEYNLLDGVPNTAFTEALAFVFQAKDLELLGLAKPDETSEALGVLDSFWGTCEIGAVALVDMRMWRWMYENPDATPAELRDATIGISKDVWNEFFAPIFGKKDVVLLGIYSHMISSVLYLPDYPIGHMIAHQIREQMDKAGNIGAEFERMTVQGRLIPDVWMKRATGAPVGPQAMLAATERALKRLEK